MVRLVAAALALAALVAAALAVRGTGAEVVRARGGRIAIALDDFRLHPELIRARRGPLTVVLHNRGRLGHSFRLRQGRRTALTAPTLRPGETRRVTVRLRRGDYRMFDALSNYEELGMYGTLVVR